MDKAKILLKAKKGKRENITQKRKYYLKELRKRFLDCKPTDFLSSTCNCFGICVVLYVYVTDKM